jgi:hypothetical protein
MFSFVLRAVLLVCALLLLPSAASAQTVTKTVTIPGTAVFQHGANPSKPGNCSALTFVQWTNPAGATVTRATAKMKSYGREVVVTAEGPAFHDTTDWVKVYTVTPGAHWILMGKSWADGPIANDCADMNVKHQENWDRSFPVTVDLTIDNSATCTKAQAALKKARTGLTKARSRLKKAKSSKAKARQRTSVKKNQASVKKAQAKATSECSSS